MKKLIPIFILLITTCLYSTIINVPADQPTIQAGIVAAADTDTVLVADGTYFENIDFISKPITVASNFLIDADPLHIENTIINGSQATNPDLGSCVRFTSNEDTTSVIIGFTLTEGTGTLDPGWGTIAGGIWMSGSSPTICNNIITENSADYTGGVSCAYSSNPRIIDNVISYNTSTTLNCGGLEFYQNSNAYVEGNIISNNFAQGHTGGVSIELSYPTFINNIIENNSSNITTGGVLILNSSPTFVCNIIRGNSALGDNVGGLAIQDSDANIINCLISGNNCDGVGGGILVSNSQSEIINCTIVGNLSYDQGGGICNSISSNSSLVNCILWDNLPEQIYIFSGSVTVIYSDIQDGWTGTGNIDEDPLFVGTGDHPFMLQDLSPCVNTGDPNTTGLNLPELDLAGNSRIYGGRIDMGAYENQNVVGVDDLVIPSFTQLHQNYPNPFNPTTTISYQLPEESEVELTIYNLKGQKVKQLVNDQLPDGQHSIVWNGKDDNGKSVSSSIYFYKLKTDNHEETKKMILMK